MVKMDRAMAETMGIKPKIPEISKELAKNMDQQHEIQKLFYSLAAIYGEQSLLEYIERETVNGIVPSVVVKCLKEENVSSGIQIQIRSCLRAFRRGDLTPLSQPELQSKKSQVLESKPDDLNWEKREEKLKIIMPGFPTEAEEHRGVRLTPRLGQILFLMNLGKTDEEIITLLEIKKESFESQKNLLFRTILGRPRKRGKQTDPIDLKEIIQKAKELGFLGEKVPSADSK